MKKILTLTVALMAVGTMVQAGGCGGSHSETKSSADKIQTMPNIVETAVAADGFNTLVAAVKAAGLVEALSGEGPFTVFAPTDDAFAALPEGTIEKLLKDKEQLTSILTYHVAEGSLKAGDVVKMESVSTLNGQSASIAIEDDKAMIDNATIIATDIMCGNGVIHVIDAVIMPSNEKEQALLTE